MGGGPMAMIKGEKARDFKGTMAKLIQYLGTYKFSILVVLLIAVASTIFSIIGPKILGQATTKLFEGVMSRLTGKGSIDFSYYWEDPPGRPRSVSYFRPVCIHPGMGHVRHLDEDHLPLPPGYLAQDQPPSA